MEGLKARIKSNLRTNRRGMLLAVLPGVVLVLAGSIGVWGFGLRLNTTDSLPQRLWQVTSGPLEKGGYAIACVPIDAPAMRDAIERNYLGEGPCPGELTPVIKQVMAVPGDVVTLTADAVIVNGQAIPNTKTRPYDSFGRKLEAFPRGTYLVAPDTYWLIANYNTRSFDSRYFGPISKQSIQNSARPFLNF